MTTSTHQKIGEVIAGMDLCDGLFAPFPFSLAIKWANESALPPGGDEHFALLIIDWINAPWIGNSWIRCKVPIARSVFDGMDSDRMCEHMRVKIREAWTTLRELYAQYLADPPDKKRRVYEKKVKP